MINDCVNGILSEVQRKAHAKSMGIYHRLHFQGDVPGDVEIFKVSTRYSLYHLQSVANSGKQYSKVQIFIIVVLQLLQLIYCIVFILVGRVRIVDAPYICFAVRLIIIKVIYEIITGNGKSRIDNWYFPVLAVVELA